jgi:hypothetical protein
VLYGQLCFSASEKLRVVPKENPVEGTGFKVSEK